GPSQGNWVTGTPYPMCNPVAALINPFATNYKIQYFPTMYMICPDKTTTSVDQFTTAQLVSAMNATCPPPTTTNDAGVYSISNPFGFSCGTTFSPSVTLRNFGSSTLTSCTINYKIDNGANQTYAWTGSLAANASVYSGAGAATVTLPAVTVSLGTHSITVSSSNPNSTTDGNTANDGTTVTFTAVTPTSSPVVEGMESTFPSSLCAVVNPDNSTTWTKSTPGGFGTSSNSAMMDCYNYAASGALDYLVLSPMNFATATSPGLTFNVAYAPYDATFFEQLDVEVSTDCGSTWTNVYSKSGSTLGTAAATTTQFVPTATQWRAESVSLSSYIGQASVLVRLICTNHYGNDMYVDDINLSTNTSAVNEIDLSSYVSVFPNPTNGNVFININNSTIGNVDVKVINVMGEVVSLSKNNSSRSMKFDLSNMSNGIYFVEVSSSNGKTIKKVMLNK
ncbi:MAG TPA: T9SS type A sorting domain-containing protein, partial [Bacteroidia bacterium]